MECETLDHPLQWSKLHSELRLEPLLVKGPNITPPSHLNSMMQTKGCTELLDIFNTECASEFNIKLEM